MAYQPDEADAMRHAWATACDADRWPGWATDLDRYLAHDRVKTAIVDSVRYAKAVTVDPSRLDACAENLAQKLTMARRVWQDPRPVNPAEVASQLSRRP
jgi:hypothetical protein